jgi:hypothetical protein
MLLAGPNDVGKSALVGRWLAGLDRRRFCPLLLTHASLSGCGLLSALVGQLGRRAAFQREANLAVLEAALAELLSRPWEGRQTRGRLPSPLPEGGERVG